VVERSALLQIEPSVALDRRPRQAEDFAAPEFDCGPRAGTTIIAPTVTYPTVT
jgi:hypothetical protein